MKISINNGRLEARDCYAQREALKARRWRWDPVGRCWWTRNPVAGEGVCPEAVLQALRDDLCRAEAQAGEAVIASQRATSTLSVPVPDGRAYLPYQLAGIEYALGRADTLIGDEMGLGKTIQAIGVINQTNPDNVLIVCPASLKLNWQRELGRWLVTPREAWIVDTKRGWQSEASIVIINYDILAKFRDQIQARAWNLLICDECHYLKNPKTGRTKQVLGARTKTAVIDPIRADRKLFLTGTPICNRPIELWPLVHALDPTDMGRNWRGFVTRYCDGKQTRFGWDVSGASNLAELQTRLRSKFMVRRLKKDVLTELPAKRRQVIELPCNGARPYVEAELETWQDREKLLAGLRSQVEALKDGDKTEYETAVKKLRAELSIAFSEMAKARHDTAVAKLPAVIAFLHDLIDDDPDAKIVFFAHHHDVLTPVFEAFADKAVLFTGETKLVDRQSAVDRFQTDSTCNLFIGSTTAAGVGITLTASSHVVFGELDWTPGNVSQAEDRCHRIGQTDSVLVQHVVLDGSLDAVMAHKLVAKQSVIDAALNNNNDDSII